MFSSSTINREKDIKIIAPKGQRSWRSFAFQLLYAIDRLDYDCNLEDMLILYEQFFSLEIDRSSFGVEIIEGVLLNRENLDETIQPLIDNWSYDRVSCVTKLILQMACWELLYFKKNPFKTVIDEYLELSKAFSEPDSYRFVNGVLDKLVAKENLYNTQNS